jgi:signal transduction histidine kinase
MRPMLDAIAVLVLLGVLTWLLLRGIDGNATTYEATLQAFDDFALAEASLHRDVLQARAGLLPHYDSLGIAIEAMEGAVARLRSHAEREGLDLGPVDRLAATVAQHENLTESFKSSNALLQNSLSYVGLLSTNPVFGARDTGLPLFPTTTTRKLQAGALAAAILHLVGDASPRAAAALQDQIDRFDAQRPLAGPAGEAEQALLAHARLLEGLLPSVDATLTSLVSVPSREALEATRTLFANHQAALEAIAERYRLMLYLTSVLLVVVLVRLGLRLRARALALRQRASFEHLIAENSTRLINCSPAETTARLNEVLAELARAIGAERAYVVIEGSPARIHAWCDDGAAYPPGWPVRALALFQEGGSAGTDILTVPDVTTLPAGKTKKTLEAVGVRGWVCVPLMRPGRVQGIMAFDTFRPAWDKMFPLPVVRLAGNAMVNAIEREFLERDRATLATRVERARRMQMVGSLASGIAHNFNNIIGAILGYSEMVELQLVPGSKSAQHVDEIRRAAERGRDLIDNILTFGRRRDARVQSVWVRSLFQESASLLRASLPASVDLRVADIPADIVVSGESAQLQQIILNLCTNAAQAIEGSGSIRITAEPKDVAAPLALSHGELAPGRFVCLSVADTGRGFDESVAQRLFEPFFTTRKAGTGLGLATVHEIVRDHDGAINVQSKPEHGSHFEVWLPALADSATPDTRALPLGRGETVLIVESERLPRDEEMLAALGYEPVGFERADDAIAACRSVPDRFDAVVIGRIAADVNDLQVAQVLHRLMPRPPILLATASVKEVSVDELAEAGISELLRRPLDSSELAAVLARRLRSASSYRRNAISDC